MRDIGKNIKDLRISKNMTQDQLAEKLFVTRQTVSNYETGKSRPDIDTIVKLGEVLGCDVDSILYGIPPTTQKKNEYIKTAVAVVLCIVCLLVSRFVISKLFEIKQNMYIGSLYAFWIFIFTPVINIILGWTAMQFFGSVFRIKIIRSAWTVYIRRILLCLVAVYVVYIFINFGPAAIEDLIYIIKKPSIDFLNNYSLVFPNIMLFIMKYDKSVFPVFLAVGAVLWLCGFPQSGNRNTK